MSNPIVDRVTVQMYGDKDLQQRILHAISAALSTEPVVKSDKPYETKRGQAGNYINASIDVSPIK